MIDLLPAGDAPDLGERSEQREMIGLGAASIDVVYEADHLIAQLAVLKYALRHHASEFAGARDQDALEPDAGAPPSLEQLAHDLARAVRRQDVEHEEQRPDGLRDLEG